MLAYSECNGGEVIPVLTPEEMRAVDAAAREPVEVLIDRAPAPPWRERPSG